MHNNLTNLLPLERQRALVRNYFLRLSVVSVVCVTILVLISAILLLPTYLLLTDAIYAKETHLRAVESALSPIDADVLSARFAFLNDSVAALSVLAEAPSASATLRSVLLLGRASITLSNFTYTPGDIKTLSTLTISGVAMTRDALRTYQLTLEESPLVRSASLPVSAYAKDSDISFTITVTFEP